MASAIANIMLTLSPERIVLGGGVMQQAHIFPLIRGRVLEILQGYGVLEEIVEGIDGHIVPPGLGEDSGIAGAFALAEGGRGVTGHITPQSATMSLAKPRTSPPPGFHHLTDNRRDVDIRASPRNL